MKKIVLGLIFSSLFLQSSLILAENRLKVFKVYESPIIDGNGDDSVWTKGQEIMTHDRVAGLDILLNAVYTEKQIFFLVRFPDPDESRLHKPWIWNKKNDIYDMGPQREDCFVIKWAMDNKVSDLSLRAEMPYRADLWFWKACRTDPAGYADDKMQRLDNSKVTKSMKILSRSGKEMYLRRMGDEGSPAYKAMIQIEYTKDTISQFSHKKPSGSRADIRAKGFWHKGQWCIEIARSLNTGHQDDVQFEQGRNYLFGVSRYEIAGREPDPKLSQPFYGAGDISEKLWLFLEE